MTSPFGLNEVSKHLVGMLGELLENGLGYGSLNVRVRRDQSSRGLDQNARVFVLAEIHEHGERTRMPPGEAPDCAGRFSAHGLRRIASGKSLQFR